MYKLYIEAKKMKFEKKFLSSPVKLAHMDRKVPNVSLSLMSCLIMPGDEQKTMKAKNNARSFSSTSVQTNLTHDLTRINVLQ